MNTLEVVDRIHAAVAGQTKHFFHFIVIALQCKPVHIINFQLLEDVLLFVGLKKQLVKMHHSTPTLLTN